MTTLDRLPIDSKATINSLHSADKPLLQKLLVMGIVAGTEVSVVRQAPLKDPITIKARQFELSLRRSEASCVEVTPL